MLPADIDRVLAHCRKIVAANHYAFVDPDTLWMASFIVETRGTPFPSNDAAPRTVHMSDNTVVTIADLTFEDRAKALGIATALIRRALALEKPEHACGQCGWSGHAFHACPGLPGENQF